MQERDVFLANKRNILKQRPKLLYIGLNNNMKGWISAPHSHDFSEILFIRSGSGKVQIGEMFYPIKKGDLIIYNKGVMHTEFSDDVTPRELIFFGLGNLKLTGLEEGSILKNKDFCIIPTESYYDTMNGYLTELLRETEADEPFHEYVTESLVKITLLMILRIAAFDINLTFTKNNAYIEAKEYFDKNFATIGDLDSVCKSLYINKFYLTHVFKEQMGIPPVKYLILKRIDYAKNLLVSTDQNVGDVAKACGYVDTGYFCRVFKSIEGVTPLQYRFHHKKYTYQKPQ